MVQPRDEAKFGATGAANDATGVRTPLDGPPGGYGTDLPPGTTLDAYSRPQRGGADSLALTSFVLGIASLLGALVCLGMPLGAAAVVTGALALAKAKDSQSRSAQVMAIVGILLGVIGAVGWVGLYIAGTAVGLLR